MFDIQLSGKAPIYEQLYGGIAALIASGRLKADEKLPAVREVAKSLGINPNTVQKAYAQLESAGLIYSMPAKGSYVSAQPQTTEVFRVQALQKLSAELKNARGFGVTYDEVMDAVKQIWSDDGNGGEV